MALIGGRWLLIIKHNVGRKTLESEHMTFIKQLSVLLGLITLLIQPSWGAALAGHVILTKGDVSATSDDGITRILIRRSEIFNGDTIKTGHASSVQIRFVDKALITIKNNSEMNIERYLLAQEENGQKEQAIMKLLKGGFRTITGTIGKGDKSAYKVSTPAASIGVRGTNYEVQQEPDGSFVMGVYSGGIKVENDAGFIELGVGANFNFTRVKARSAPKGLLIPPPILGQNMAIELDDEADDKGDQLLSENIHEEGSGESQIDVNGHNVNGASDQESADLADLDIVKNHGLDEVVESDNHNANDDTASNKPDIPFPNVNDDIEDAIENEVAEDIQEAAESIPPAITLFNFSDPYNGIDIINSTNPFAPEIISTEQFELAASGNLALLSIPVNATTSYAGSSPSIATLEAQLISPGTALDSSHNFITQNGHLTLSYEVYNLTTQETDEYEIDFVVNATTLGAGSLLAFMDTALVTSYRKNHQSVTGTPPNHINISYAGGKYSFSPTNDSDNFILEMELHFDDDANSESAIIALLQELGSIGNEDEGWHYESGLGMNIGDGSWDSTSNRPILVIHKTPNTQGGGNGNGNGNGNGGGNSESINVSYKFVEADETTTNLLAFGNCITQGKTCDIQVDNVDAGENIRWGAWLAEPDEGIQLNQFNVGNSTLEFQEEEDILAFWIAAERANINQLTGSASFSANSDCANFNQCIGFADDGIVQNLTAQFDVDFNSGAISNGNLTLQTTADPNLATSGGIGDVMSTWDVNFSGQMSVSDDGTTKLPEFQTQSISGTVVESSGSSDAVIGNIGGIFVKPGDKFAGGYNLGTADGTNKHAAGVFSMEKQ